MLDDVPDDALAGDLGTVTDSEWLVAHQQLCDDLVDLVPPEQLAYVYEPTRPPSAFISADEVEPAPQVGEWDPFHDERFERGGFRG